MTYPHHSGSPSDPLHRRLPAGNAPHSPLQEYLNVGGYQGGSQGFGYDYDSSQASTSPSRRPVPYPSPNLQGRQHLNIGVPHSHDHIPTSGMTPSITFGMHGGSQQQQLQFFPNGMVDGSSEPSSTLGESGSPFSSFHQDGLPGGSVYLVPPVDWSPNQASTGNSAQQQASTGPAKGAKGNPNKVPRHQFTACGACRHRRVKCDLRARQEEAEREAFLDDAQNGNTGSLRHRRASCTNCQERGTNCVDEYAPLKAAKQLRRGKRISEIEMLYGKSATDAALASQGDEGERSLSPGGRKMDRIPELTREFFDSQFFRRFILQRPIVDSLDFVTVYLSKPIPCAAAMGSVGAVLCHCLYAWGLSYGVDERGQLDVAEAGGETVGPLNLLSASESEARRERDRQRRKEKFNGVVRTILREIDEYGILRRPSWDGIRAVLLILPLTEGISTPVERQALYQSALSQVQLLCTNDSFGYDGLPVTLPLSPSLNSNPNKAESIRLTQLRIFWYAFVHESITVGLRGGKLCLEDENDLSFLEQALDKQPTTQSPGHLHISSAMVAAPVRFALACRRIHAVLSGAKARKRDLPDVEQLHSIWESLDQSWEEFDNLKNEPSATPYREHDEVASFADGWKMSVFEAQNAILRQLEERLERLQAKSTRIDSSSLPPSPRSNDLVTDLNQLRHLHELARTRCEIKMSRVMDIIRGHLGAQMFEWDASLVRDGTYQAAMMLVATGGSDDDVSVCLQALNESRWAHSKSWERSQDLRKAWYAKRSNAGSPMGDAKHSLPDTCENSSAPKSRNDSPFTSPAFDSFSHIMPSQPSSAPPGWVPPGPQSYHDALVQRSKSDTSAFGAYHSRGMMDSVKQEFSPDGLPPDGYFQPTDGHMFPFGNHHMS
ncbi:uncharacterized protein CcaverHIS019_0105070 [Cutaneotrichosporon cavernicola]|uniref:Zn(2)-C6 fungal-type domain-containing protein n=1 Tax=Cutaneotrichosporon cavernicola TaxID=279322 RepID=A0AA48HYD5_9TREE|nr:uncharacterized protein CcaverHIS019_0105070 [Cutaneotrichosporon cavernicola]BEI87789.1 hypothetical protein CcaverHIS019_0105070 [Cutaneotrichosporon cavernicola]